jgi:hypothetical protein
MIIMQEPDHNNTIKDIDGYRWKWDERNSGWTLWHFEHILAYVGLQWPKLEHEYGPLIIE